MALAAERRVKKECAINRNEKWFSTTGEATPLAGAVFGKSECSLIATSYLFTRNESYGKRQNSRPSSMSPLLQVWKRAAGLGRLERCIVWLIFYGIIFTTLVRVQSSAKLGG